MPTIEQLAVSNVVVDRSSMLSVLIYGIGIVVVTWLYYGVLKLQNLRKYSKPYSAILVFMIGMMLINMGLAICNPPTTMSEPATDIAKVMSRVSLMVSYIFVINIMIRDYNRTHTANSKIVQHILIIITVCILLITAILWVPTDDIVINRAIRGVVTVCFTIAMGFLVILIIDIIKRGNEAQSPAYLEEPVPLADDDPFVIF